MDSIREILTDGFPARLREMHRPPEKLYVKGTLPPENRVHLTVVGARRYSDYGRDACEMLIEGLRGLPVVIVSGLALGIDSIAHRAALKNGLATIAVPGSGISDEALYPAAHRELAREIVERGGAVLSPFDPDMKATEWSFPVRNRVMAGLSNAVLIIEAEKKSGTLITGKYATELNRDVLTVPGPIFSKNSEGPHMLIRLGATPISSAAELIDALGLESAKTVEEKDYSDLSPDEMRIVKLLETPMPREELIGALDMDIQEVSSLLSILELKGHIRETLGEFRLD
ncbi:MAG: DNA-processing protein DprA [Candidatus Paceibacterota bacterium]|jgi:DNA processing protein